MKIACCFLPRLQTLLKKTDQLRAEREGVSVTMKPVTAAIDRLKGKIATLTDQAGIASVHAVPPAASRIELLIAGADAPGPDRKKVEDAASKLILINANLEQCFEDLAAVEAHLTSLQASVAATDTALRQAEIDLYDTLSEAAVDAYKSAAAAFVEENLPALHSVFARAFKLKGEWPPGYKLVDGGLSVSWYEGTIVQETKNHAPRHELSVLWPRPLGALLSGGDVVTNDAVNALIAAVRAEAA